uniref:Ribonuclease P protein subunit p25-like protein n=1 Tax=Ceratitis capitata TaxID=7213 RepID=W8BK95_CERCA
MMHYRKGENIEQELSKDDLPFDDCLTKLPQKDFLWMHVRGGTKVHNVLNYAKNALDKGEYRTVVWSGSGGGVVKTVSCAEIFKRSFPLYQLTRMDQVSIEEHWEPQMDGLEPIVAKRKVPSLHILMTLDPIDECISDVQKPNTTTEYWRGSNGSTQTQKQPRRNGPSTSNAGQTPRQRQNQRPPKQARPEQGAQTHNEQQEQSENSPSAGTPRERQQRPQNLKRNRNDQRKSRNENNAEQSQPTAESQQQREGTDEPQRQQQSQRQRRHKPRPKQQQQQSPKAMQVVEATESATTTSKISAAAAVAAVEPMES